MKNERRSRVIVIESELIQSNAFRELGKNAIIVYMFFLSKRRIEKTGRKGNERIIIANNGQIQFTYAEAKEKLGLGAKQFTRAIDELIEYGFIELAQKGAAFGNPSLYRISTNWQNFGNVAFNIPKRKKRESEIGYCRRAKSTLPGRSIDNRHHVCKGEKNVEIG